ncbi:hypothetical protein [Paraburkholderia bannensis]|uniref:hypothetical protein n=1 Tax=Paraburkholderia bannensis TaxID=765414 RepID=UPI00048A3402|nr:hypothetical protein [Paraburkholderia bannensis]
MVVVNNSGKKPDIGASILVVALANGVFSFFTYQLARAAIFGVVFGSNKRGHPWRDVFHATAPSDFYGIVTTYAMLDSPAILLTLCLVIVLFRALLSQAD